MPTKSSVFPPVTRELAAFAKSLSHPARIAIVTLLMERGQTCCGDIVAALPLAQATVSQHLRELHKAGLVTSRPCGQHMCYQLDQTRIREFCTAFQKAIGTCGETPPIESDCCE